MTGLVFTRWLMGVPQLLLGAFFCWLWAEFTRWEFYLLAVFFLAWGILAHAISIKAWNMTFIHDPEATKKGTSG